MDLDLQWLVGTAYGAETLFPNKEEKRHNGPLTFVFTVHFIISGRILYSWTFRVVYVHLCALDLSKEKS